MNIAARTVAAAPIAVSLLLGALAASAVSAPAPAVVEIDDDLPLARDWHAWSARMRELTVVGSAQHDEMTWALQRVAFSACATTGARVTLYAHFSGGVVTNLEAYGTDADANACAMQRIEKLTVPVLDEMDVMIPIDFETD